MMPWNDAIRPKSPSHTSMCSQLLLPPTMAFMACGSGSLMLASLVQSPTPPANAITPIASATRVRMPATYAIGIERRGFFASSAAIATPSIARKNQIANGIAASMPGIAAALNTSCPAQPPRTKFAAEKPGDTTPMNTSSSPMARMVIRSSKLAASCTPTMFRVMNTR